ncbi:hypothetical protein VMCG_05676 [Cytospora schulzeri]|uniref:Uncharacterized protein n=1 Tax=Cytospora schulzeri TaxID=448051 RepID=A0A423WI00_9PEZI|nr:hypothetical protein VMCG_05676 [Valsa malicola]
MAPQTRSRVSDGAARVSYYEPPPPSPPAKTPASRGKPAKKPKVYRRSDPAPQQAHFPARKTTIRTYGKNRRSLPSKTPDQSTLTQIGWIPSTYQNEDEDEEEEENVRRFNDTTTVDDEDDWKAEERKRRSKRRRTTGDIVPSSTANSSYHTQTLTQMPSFMSGQQPEDDELQGDFDFNTDEEKNDSVKAAVADEIYEATPEKNKKKEPSPSVLKGDSRSSLPPRSPTGSIVAQTQTPRKQTAEREVIPSSQPSPFTPNLGIADRYLTNLDRTPLIEKSTNVDAPTPIATGKRRRTLEIADSWSTVNGGMGSSPVKESQRVHRTPLKEIYPGDMADVSLELGESSRGGYVPLGKRSVVEDGVAAGTEEAGATSQKPARPAEEIILDSDDEFGFEIEDENEDDEEVPGTPTPIHRSSAPVTEAVSPDKGGPPMPSAPKAATQPSSHVVAQRNPTPEPPAEDDEVEPETPSPTPQRRPSMSSALDVERETPISSPQKTSPVLPSSMPQVGSRYKTRAFLSPQKSSAAMPPPVSQMGYRYKSQAFESQRVPFEKIRQLGPQTDRSDVILSVHPEQAEQMAEGIKTHEFRNYRIPQTVNRIWIYVTRPVCELMYMAPISAAKQPGEIAPEDHGVGNAEFNEGRGPGAGARFAYELKQVYELNNPVSLARMKEKGWVEEAPAKYVYVPPAVLGELLGNLRCALFAEPGELVGSSSQVVDVDMSVSQEVAMQLRGDVARSTQMNVGGSSQLRREVLGNDEDDEDAVPSSQAGGEEHGNKAIRAKGAPLADEVVFAKPTIPPSRSQRGVHRVEDSPVGRRSQRSQRSQHAANFSTVRPSQATTASAPSSPSQHLPPPPRQRVLQNTQGQQLEEASIPLSPPTKSVRRLHELMGSSTGVSSYPDDMEIVGDSPVGRRQRQRQEQGGAGVETQTSVLLGSSSQGFGLGEEDSLLDDTRVRQPPDVVWDSEGEIE